MNKRAAKIGILKILFHPTHMRPGRALLTGFALIILIGTAFLSLPIASTSGSSVGGFTALFTSTSAVCVTGLTVVETGVAYTRFGQVIIMLLIQVGGLGFMGMTMSIYLITRRRITLRNRMLMREAMNEDALSGLIHLSVWLVGITFVTEALGALALATVFIPEFGIADGAFYSVFHSVSAFCNAGFDIIGKGNSIVSYQDNPVINITIMLLIIMGGIGFAVTADILSVRRWKKLKMQSRLVLLITGCLILFGWLMVFLLEYDNPATLGNMPLNLKLMTAAFQSVTTRTTGFATMNQLYLRDATKIIIITLMFIGASPASTGGGIKTTTFGVLIFSALATMRGLPEIDVFGRSISRPVAQRAFTVALIALFIVIFSTVWLAALGVNDMVMAVDYAFEAVSALGTVGLSTGITPHMSFFSRSLLIVLMFIGRLGPLTLALALARRQAMTESTISYPEAHIMIG